MSKNKKIVITTKSEIQKKKTGETDRDIVVNAIADEMRATLRHLTGKTRSTDPKEISRRKTNRLRAKLDLVARRMGYTSWSNFGKQFNSNLIPLEEGGTEAQVNAIIKAILLRSAKAVMPGSKELDTELREVIEKNPRIRKKW